MKRVVVAALCLAGCAGPGVAPVKRARHVVLVTIDTLRADRLGCYGSRDVETPFLDAIARDGGMAQDATAGVPLTRPSHVSLFTGLYPSENGIRDNVSATLAPDRTTLAQVFSGAGFKTAGFVSSVVLSSQSGLNRGFQTYGDSFEIGDDDARFLNTIRKRGDETIAAAVSWLEGHKEGRLFLWIHLYDPHDPYDPPEPFATRYAGRPYDGGVAWTDSLMGRLESALTRLGLRSETLLLVTSDHGEGLGEHGEMTHGFFLYQSTLRVPLLARGPGIPPGTRLGVLARTVDIFPTVLDFAGVPPPAGVKLSGRSLAPGFRGREPLVEEGAYAESLLPLLHFGWSDLRMLRDARYKYIEAPRPELYDLKDDPDETRNVASTQPTTSSALRVALRARLEAERMQSGTPPAGASVPADLLEKLGALGYLGAGTASPGPSAGADPKDKIEEFKSVSRLVREGLLRLRKRDYSGSVERFTELRARGIESFEVHYYLARALLGLKRASDAAPEFEAALAHLPGFVPAYLSLAECRESRGDSKGALDALRSGEKAAPKDARLYLGEARLLRRRKSLEEASAAYRGFLKLEPEDPLVHMELGEVERDLGHLDNASALMRDAVRLEPSEASYWNSLGMVLGARGDLEAAEAAFKEALARGDRRSYEYAYNAGLAALRLGRRDEAKELFERALSLDQAFSPARARLSELASR